jgi:hypothetical protein
VSRTLLAAEEMVSVARSRAPASDSSPPDCERGLPLALPRVRLAGVRLAPAPLPLEELRPEDRDDPPRERDDRARLAAAEACGPLPSPPLLPACDAPCVEAEPDSFPLEPRALRDLVLSRCVAVAIFQPPAAPAKEPLFWSAKEPLSGPFISFYPPPWTRNHGRTCSHSRRGHLSGSGLRSSERLGLAKPQAG